MVKVFVTSFPFDASNVFLFPLVAKALLLKPDPAATVTFP